MNDFSKDALTLLGKVGRIRRARDFHLYTERGIRLIDFYQSGGMAILGHRPGTLTHSLKNAQERGVYAPFPSVEQSRLEKALLRCFHSYSHVRFFANYERALAGISGLSFGEWFPWRDKDTDREAVLLLHLPLPGGLEPVPVLFRDSPENMTGDLLSPVAAAGALSLVGRWNFDRDPGDRAFWKALPRPDRFWRREGPWLFPRELSVPWHVLFSRFLDNGILIPPQPESAAIIPLIVSPHETKLFATVLEDLSS